MKSLKLIFMLFICIFTQGCQQPKHKQAPLNSNNKAVNHNLIQNKKQSFYISKNIETLKNCSPDFFIHSRFKIQDNKLIYGGYDNQSNIIKLFIKNLETGKLYYSPHKVEFVSKLKKYNLRFKLIMFSDKGYALLCRLCMIILDDSMQMKYLLNILPKNNTSREIHPLFANFVGSFDNFIAVNTYFKYNMSKIEDRIKYYRQSYGYGYYNKNDSIHINQDLGIKFPSNYKKGTNYYSIPYFYLNKAENNNIIASFPHNDSVFIYNNGKLSDCKYFGTRLNYSVNEVPEDIMNYKTRNIYFTLDQPHYNEIYYNPYKEQYYRIFSHRVKFDEIGLKRDLSKMTWSLIVADKNLNISKEYYFENNPDSLHLFNNAICCANNGIWMRSFKQEQSKGRIYFHLYRLKE